MQILSSEKVLVFSFEEGSVDVQIGLLHFLFTDIILEYVPYRYKLLEQDYFCFGVAS